MTAQTDAITRTTNSEPDSSAHAVLRTLHMAIMDFMHRQPERVFAREAPTHQTFLCSYMRRRRVAALPDHRDSSFWSRRCGLSRHHRDEGLQFAGLSSLGALLCFTAAAAVTVTICRSARLTVRPQHGRAGGSVRRAAVAKARHPEPEKSSLLRRRVARLVRLHWRRPRDIALLQCAPSTAPCRPGAVGARAPSRAVPMPPCAHEAWFSSR